MNNISGNLNNSAGIRIEQDDEGDSLATWLQATFKQQRDNGTHVTMTDAPEREGQG